MQVLSYAVNSFFPTPLSYQQPQVLVFVNQFLGEANYSKGFAAAQGARGKIVSYYLDCAAVAKFRRFLSVVTAPGYRRASVLLVMSVSITCMDAIAVSTS